MIVVLITILTLVRARPARLMECDEFSADVHIPTFETILPPNRSCCAYFYSYVESGGEPVASIPSAMMQAYSLWGRTQIDYMFFKDKYAGGAARVGKWDAPLIDTWMREAALGTTPIRSNYLGSVENFISKALVAYPVKGKRGCVIGSESPWLEALLLANGATHITTIEYGVIMSTHPQVTAYTPAAIRRKFIDGRLEPFDFCFSYSSIEHSGLGRYGDRLQPFGDFEMVERVRCMLKPSGLFYNGVPTSDKDCLVFNAHRVYGPVRLALMSKDRWTRLGQYGSGGVGCDQWWFQPVHVWQKINN